MLRELIISMRPNQWYKNFIIFVGIIFSKNLLEMDLLYTVILAFLVFCGLSGSEYLINDILDRKEDRKHPKKRLRPIASGRLSVASAAAAALVLVAVSLATALYIGLPFFLIAALYLLVALAYSFSLKHMAHVDFITISVLFVIRAWAGGAAINVRISEWLIICAFLLAMFLAVAKRRHELLLLGDDAGEHRATLKEYSPEMLDQMLAIISAVLLMAYCLYTFIPSLEISQSAGANRYMMLTIPFVIFGLFRYLYLVHRKDYGGEVEMLFKDTPLAADISLWVASAVLIMYGIPETIISHIPGL